MLRKCYDFDGPAPDDRPIVAGLHNSVDKLAFVELTVNEERIAESTGSMHEGQVNDLSSQSSMQFR